LSPEIGRATKEYYISKSIEFQVPKLSVHGLKAYYMMEAGPSQAVDGVSFELDKNEIIGIVGESGSGKSSLGAALMRSMQPPGKMLEGTIELDGDNISQLPESNFNHKVRWKKISMVFQGAMNALDPVYTVESQLTEILREHCVDERKWKEVISASLQSVGLDSAIGKRYPHELSGGMKQRVVIAMAILLEPDLLIADEPTTALDVLIQKKIIDLLKKLRNERRMNVILISHDLALMSAIADKLAIMYAGQLVEIGSTKEIYKNPRHPYTQALIKAIPRLRSKDKKIHFIPGRPPRLVHPPKGCRYYERCPHAIEVCKEPVPEFRTESGYVRCWLYDPASHRE
jgi:peptide/nickel transport system ATP-binding protein